MRRTFTHFRDLLFKLFPIALFNLSSVAACIVLLFHVAVFQASGVVPVRMFCFVPIDNLAKTDSCANELVYFCVLLSSALV